MLTENLEEQLARSFQALEEYLAWSYWHHVTFVKPFLDELALEEVKPDFIVE